MTGMIGFAVEEHMSTSTLPDEGLVNMAGMVSWNIQECLPEEGVNITKRSTDQYSRNCFLEYIGMSKFGIKGAKIFSIYSKKLFS